MEYLHLFEDSTAHDAVYNGEGYNEPWVAYIEHDEMVTYNKPHDYSKDYFTIEALGTGNVYFKYQEWNPTETQRYMEYSKDGGETWVRTNNADNNEVVMTIPMSEGEIAFVRGDNDTLASYYESEDTYYNPFFYSDIEFNVYGNIMSLIHGSGFVSETTVTDNMFCSLFCDIYGDDFDTPLECLIINAENLILPATTLAEGCYTNMFQGCTSLTTAPELPATTLAQSCYGFMFSGCTALTTAPELPATTLANGCYGAMFNGCTALTTAPELPATTLAGGCYYEMFNGCTSLTTAPELPATTLAQSCYSEMFRGCTSLTASPELPATTLANYCYYGMFYGCTALTAAPELPATTLANDCYGLMFDGCTSLTAVPSILPATTLADACYGYMFSGCTALTTAPVLPATTLAGACYGYMFNGCTSLNYIKAMFTTTPSITYTYNWVSGVASTGTFVKNSAATWTTTGANGIPNNWTVETASA